MEDIINSNKIIQKVAKNCLNAKAIIEVGLSGVGKTTFIHGASGYKLTYCPQTESYRNPDPTLAAQFIIGDDMTSETT